MGNAKFNTTRLKSRGADAYASSSVPPAERDITCRQCNHGTMTEALYSSLKLIVYTCNRCGFKRQKEKENRWGIGYV